MSIVLTIKNKSSEKDVELMLTRGSVVKAERRGMLDMRLGEQAPISHIYALAYAGVLHEVPQATQEQVDDALEVYLDNGGSLADLATDLAEQYASLFDTADGTATE